MLLSSFQSLRFPARPVKALPLLAPLTLAVAWAPGPTPAAQTPHIYALLKTMKARSTGGDRVVWPSVFLGAVGGVLRVRAAISLASVYSYVTARSKRGIMEAGTRGRSSSPFFLVFFRKGDFP